MDPGFMATALNASDQARLAPGWWGAITCAIRRANERLMIAYFRQGTLYRN